MVLSVFYFKIKYYDNVYTLFTLAYRIILCGMGGKINIDNSFRKPQSLEFPIISLFLIL